MNTSRKNALRNSITALCFILFFVHQLDARKKKNFLSDKIVRISQKTLKRNYTGFLVDWKGRAAVVIPKESFLPETKLKDSEGKSLAYTAVLVPLGKPFRKFYILILNPDSEKLPLLKVSDTNGKVKTGTSVSILGYSAKTGKSYRGSGKIEKTDSSKITITSKVRADITGAPVIDSESKQVIGMARCTKKRGKNVLAYAERIDNTADLAEIGSEEIAREAGLVGNLSSALVKYAKIYMQIESLIDELPYKGGEKELKAYFKKMPPKARKALEKELSALYKKLNNITNDLIKMQHKAKSVKTIQIPTFNTQFQASIHRAEEIVERKTKQRKERMEMILRAVGNTF